MLESLFTPEELDHFVENSHTALRRMVYLERHKIQATPVLPVLYGIHLTQRGRIQLSAKFEDQKVYMMSPAWNTKKNVPQNRDGIMRLTCVAKNCYVSAAFLRY